MPQAIVLAIFLEYSYANHIKSSNVIYTILPRLPTAFVLDNNCVRQVLQVLYQLSHCTTTFKSLKHTTLLAFFDFSSHYGQLNRLLFSVSHLKIFVWRGAASCIACVATGDVRRWSEVWDDRLTSHGCLSANLEQRWKVAGKCDPFLAQRCRGHRGL